MYRLAQPITLYQLLVAGSDLGESHQGQTWYPTRHYVRMGLSSLERGVFVDHLSYLRDVAGFRVQQPNCPDRPRRPSCAASSPIRTISNIWPVGAGGEVVQAVFLS